MSVEILPTRNSDGSALAFLVERYLPVGEVANLAASVARVAHICAEQGTGRTAVRYLQSLYLPAEDICFCLFQAPSSDAVRAVNDAGHFSFDRITSSVLTPATARPTQTTSRLTQTTIQKETRS